MRQWSIFSLLMLFCINAYANEISIAAGQHKRVAPNFTAHEFWCHHCKTAKINGSLLYRLELLRKELKDTPIHITSGYRCKHHNEEVGGVKKSQHMLGKAADIQVKGYTPIEVSIAAKKVGFSFIKVYSGWTHVDVR